MEEVLNGSGKNEEEKQKQKGGRQTKKDDRMIWPGQIVGREK